MTKEIWVGSYDFLQNAYDIDKINSLCDSNVGLYRKGFSGLVPICCGASREEVRSLLNAYRAEKEKMFRQFEDMMVELIKDLAGEDAEVRIECHDDSGVGDSFINDGIVVIPADKKGHIYPSVSLNYYYQALFANKPGADTFDEAARAVANELYADILELWAQAPERCPHCGNDNSHS